MAYLSESASTVNAFIKRAKKYLWFQKTTEPTAKPMTNF